MTIMKIYLDNITSLLQPLISLLVLITNIIFCLLHILLWQPKSTPTVTLYPIINQILWIQILYRRRREVYELAKV